jgi:hypothetical protein
VGGEWKFDKVGRPAASQVQTIDEFATLGPSLPAPSTALHTHTLLSAVVSPGSLGTAAGLPMPAFAAAVPMSMAKPLRQLTEEIMGDHRSMLVRRPPPAWPC